MTNSTNRLDRPYLIPHFDGLRGIGAFVVFLGHMAVSLYPSLTNGKPDLSGLEILPYLSRTPLSLFVAANFAVCVFFVLSGHVMAMMAQRSKESFLAITIRRYIRLAFPAAASCVLSAALLASGMYYNQSIADFSDSTWLRQWFNFEPSLVRAAKEGLFDIFRVSSSAYNSNLWTMFTEIWGSVLVFAAYFLFKNRSLRIIALAAALIYVRHDFRFVCFICGALSYEAHEVYLRSGESFLEILWAPSVATFFVCLGFYFGSYPDFTPYDGGGPIYNWLPKGSPTTAYWYHTLGAILIVHFIGRSDLFRPVFSTRPFLYLGRISFALYLIHLPLICSAGAWLVHTFRNSAGYNEVSLSVVVCLVALCIVLADLFHRWVDRPSIKFGKWISERIDRAFPAVSNQTSA